MQNLLFCSIFEYAVALLNRILINVFGVDQLCLLKRLLSHLGFLFLIRELDLLALKERAFRGCDRWHKLLLLEHGIYICLRKVLFIRHETDIFTQLVAGTDGALTRELTALLTDLDAG